MSSELHCPVCPRAPQLRPVATPAKLNAPLRRCDLCRGLLADPSTVAAATAHFHRSHYVMVEGHGRHHCRACGELFEKARQRCRRCHKEQSIGCVRCSTPMALVEVAGVTIDVCRPCRMVWFDRGELGLLTRRHPAALQSLHGHTSSALAADIPGAALYHVDALPTALEVAHAGADGAIRAVSQVSASAVVEATAAAGEGAVEITTGAVEVLFSILGDTF